MASITPSQRTCYNRNGTAMTDVAYQPCASDPTRDSPCCGTNHQGAGHLNVANDVCDPNGLCQNFEAFDGTNEGVKIWWRQGCTDPTWQSEACLKDVCNFGKYTSENAPVRNCGDGNWCCGEKACCSTTSSLFKLAAVQTGGVSASPSIKATSATTTAGATAVATRVGPSLFTPTDGNAPWATGGDPIPSPSASPESGGSSSASALSVGAKAGIGVGIAVVVILLAIIAFLLMKLRKRKQGEEQAMEKSELPVDGEKPYVMAYAHEVAPVEMNGHSAPAELGTRHPVELPGDDAGHMKASK